MTAKNTVFGLVTPCCIIMPACAVLLCYRYRFIDVYCLMFITTPVTVEFIVTQVKGIVLRILYTHACRDHRAAWGVKGD